jgi:hypothetical protein
MKWTTLLEERRPPGEAAPGPLVASFAVATAVLSLILFVAQLRKPDGSPVADIGVGVLALIWALGAVQTVLAWSRHRGHRDVLG